MNAGRWLLMGALLVPLPLAAQGPPDLAEMEAERAALFAQADADGNGSLTLDEFRTFESLFRDKRAERHFTRLDGDGDGVVSLDELQAGGPGKRPGRGHRHGPPPWVR